MHVVVVAVILSELYGYCGGIMVTCGVKHISIFAIQRERKLHFVAYDVPCSG